MDWAADWGRGAYETDTDIFSKLWDDYGRFVLQLATLCDTRIGSAAGVFNSSNAR